MAKRLKNSLIMLVGAIAFAFFGVFFVGCDSSASNIVVSSSVDYVSLQVGESETITFTLENYSSSFSNQVQVNAYYDGTSTLFSVSDPVYETDDTFSVTITALAGGQGSLKVVTYEGMKVCTVQVSVTQYSTSLEYTADLLYVSNSTPFTPTHGNFTFDANTTEKDLLYYYVTTGETDVSSGYSVTKIDGTEVTFTGSKGTATRYVMQFDTATLNTDGSVTLTLSGATVGTLSSVSEFLVLAVYEPSLEEAEIYWSMEEQFSLVCDLGTVYVLPDLDVSITGGYLVSGVATLSDDLSAESSLILSPNYSAMSNYLIRIEHENASVDASIVTNFSFSDGDEKVNTQYYYPTDDEKQDSYTVVSARVAGVSTYYTYTEQYGFLVAASPDFSSNTYYIKLSDADNGKNVTYLLLTSCTQAEATLQFSVSCSYEIAQNVSDQSVNVSETLDIDVRIAPTQISVNGTTYPETLTLYCNYSAPDFGWNDLLFEVISDSSVAPNISGITFEYSENLQITTSANVNVRTGTTYSDLSSAFKVRGYQKAGDATITVTVKCDWGDFDVSLTINCVVLSGVTAVNFTNEELSTAYLDVDGGTQNFYSTSTEGTTGYIYANDYFQSLTFTLLSGSDVATLSYDEENYYATGTVSDVDVYFLLFSITPKATGTGVYRIYTDNGTHIDLTISCIEVLDGATIKLSSSGNDDVSYYYYETDTENNSISRALYVEVQNSYSAGSLQANKRVTFEIEGNYTDLATTFVTNDGSFSTQIFPSSSTYYVTTLENGNASIRISINGLTVTDFKQSYTTLYGHIYLSAYSLLSSFYLTNGEDYALSNTIYYGPEETQTVTFTPVAESSDASNFYQYSFTDSGLQAIYEYALSQSGSDVITYSIKASTFNDYIEKTLVTEEYDSKYIFYYANKSNGTSWGSSTVTLTFTQGNGSLAKTYVVEVSIYSGLMFYFEGGYYAWTIGTDVYSVQVSTDNVYQIGSNLGTFDVAKCSYTQQISMEGETEIVISASVEQRDSTLMRYDAHIYVKEYVYAETITLISSASKIYFSSNSATAVLNVSVYPTAATNPSIRIEYVPDDSNYSKLLNWSVTNNGNGSYTIELSCEDFCSSNTNIQTIEDALSGMLYIYPTDWGSSHSNLSLTIDDVSYAIYPIEIEIEFQNGSKNNPYLLSTASDVLAINSSAARLESYYVIESEIDMSGVSGTPIGIIDGKMYGFSGCITGTTAGAAIVNFDVSSWMTTCDDDGILYVGLFAQINSDGSIENVTIQAEFSDLEVDSNAYVSALAAVNFGTITSVAVELDQSSISVADGVTMYYGAVASLNYGEILQDFSLYADGGTYAGQTSKVLAYYNDVLTITGGGASANVYAGGIVGGNAGLIERSGQDLVTLYGTGKYTAYTLIRVTGTAENVYLGGLVGISTGIPANEADSLLPYVTDYYTNASGKSSSEQVNLLVGGEISTLTCDSSVDAVGGVAGFIRAGGNDSTIQYYVTISDCTSRIFVRGHKYVAALIGIDYSDTSAGVGAFTFLTLTDNIIQAIDDGRGGIWASMIIKTDTMGVASGSVSNTSFVYDVSVYAAVGNAYDDSGEDVPSYRNTSTTYIEKGSFSATSYVTRNLSSTTTFTETNTSEFHGDLVIVSLDSDLNLSSIDTDNTYSFSQGSVSLSLQDGENSFQMTATNGGEKSVFFMTYFSVTGDLAGAMDVDKAQSYIASLNVFNPSSSLYPFVLTSSDVSIASSSSSVLSVDTSGTITLKGTGYATITLSSILNQNQLMKIYIYVVNYFDFDSYSSMFRAGTSTDSEEVTSSYTQHVYGNAYSRIYTVPTYALSATDGNGDSFYITDSGLLFYDNTWFNLSTCNDVNVEIVQSKDYDGAVSAEVSGKSIVFHKNSSASDEGADQFTFTPYISCTIDSETYTKVLTNCAVTISAKYHDAATKISTKHGYVSIQTSQDFDETVYVTSTNSTDNLFYIIFDKDGNVVQWRMPSSASSLGTNSVLEYLNLSDSDYYSDTSYSNYFSEMDDTILASMTDLFLIEFSRDGNTFTFTCKVNKNSTAYLENYSTIFGTYTITFFSSELVDGVSTEMTIELLEPELSYVSVANYSNINSMSKEDSTVVPTQRGVLEITIDPMDAVFTSITISNNSINSSSAFFSLAVEVESESGGVSFAVQSSFGSYGSDDSLTFTYAQLLALLDTVDDAVEYYGRIYVSYVMSSNGLQDGEEAGFDVTVNYGTKSSYTTTIFMNVKLSNYAKLSFDDKTAIGGYYYLARGLSYSLSLDSYGFTSDQIELTVSNQSYATLTRSGDSVELSITSGTITYPSDQDGYYLTITTTAKKIVDNVEVSTVDVLKIYIMEFVLNYAYSQGVNEDIVSGMEDGVISVSVGNPLTLELNILDFLEYDSSISEVVSSVKTFVSDMTNVTWKVYEGSTTKTLGSGVSITSEYYEIYSYTVTPLLMYDPDDDIYHFSVNGLYIINGGTYKFTTETEGAETLYTEFSLNVHNQSTKDTPLPVYDYDDLISMEEGEWYILMNDITLVSDQMALLSGEDAFTPIETEIAGLDGNGYTITFGSTSGESYTFTDLNEVGLFGTVAEDTILTNITVALNGSITFEMNTSTFLVGLIAGQNDGKITNCEAKSGSLTVNSSVSTSGAYVAGLVGANDGYITNSRSGVDIFFTDNLSGFVGQNYGHIASSYFRGGSLKNDADAENGYMAGFVIENSGEIYASYVSGDSDSSNSDNAYYPGTEDSITASVASAGFAYSNSGTISDSYSNIYMPCTYYVAGFVYENSGEVARCISLSVLSSNQSRCYGFAASNVTGTSGSDGVISDCFYLSDSDEGINVSFSAIGSSNDSTDITALDLDGFKDTSNFENFSISSGRTINSVWFFNDDASDTSNFRSSDGSGSIFNVGRIELVSANILANSIREILSTTSVTDSETGATYVVYTYKYSSSSSALGSVYNPILIYDAETFEDYIIEEAKPTMNNYSYYRLICDVDFGDVETICETYKVTFLGYLEGNFVTVENVNLTSSESDLTYAGLFAKIGDSSNSLSIGTVMNLTIKPSEVYFPATNMVGGIAGKLDGGTLVNVTVDVDMVTGTNIAGGIVGVAVGSYTIFNAYSTASAVSLNKYVNSNVFSSTDETSAFYSFAGSIAGVLSGSGTLYGSTTDTSITVLADKAGLMFGYVDSGVTVTNISLIMQDESAIDAYTYAGLVVGESKGTFNGVEITGTGSEFSNINMTLYTPTAVGGFAGAISGGTLSNISTTQSISISTESSTGISTYLGGIVGLVTARSEISNVTVGSDDEQVILTGFEYVGGIIGGTYSSTSFSLSISTFDVNVYAKAVGTRQDGVGVGGLIGLVGATTSLTISGSDSAQSTVNSEIFVQVFVYGSSTSIPVGTGAVIGYNQSVQPSVSYVTATTTISASVSLLSGTLLDTVTATLVMSEVDDCVNLEEGISSGNYAYTDYIAVSKYAGTGSHTTGSLTYYNETGTSTVALQVNVFGKLE